jgi:ABC-2 type transport system ATP-binding protein
MSLTPGHLVDTPPAAPEIVIDVHGLTKSFGGRQVVRDLSIQVKRGTIFGFLGPNGSGKTTTIRMLCGLLKPDQGGGSCLGFDIRTEAAKIKKSRRLHDATLQPL